MHPVHNVNDSNFIQFNLTSLITDKLLDTLDFIEKFFSLYRKSFMKSIHVD